MSVTTVFLVIIGLCLIIGSFLFLEKDGDAGKKQVVMLNDYELDEQELAKLQDNIRTVVKEYSDQLVEQTEQTLNTVANQKTMEISELADQVLQDIDKAHQECVFLYDMLEDKSRQIKEYVSQSSQQLIQQQQQALAEATPEQPEEPAQQSYADTAPSQVEEHLLEQVEQMREPELSDANKQEIQDVHRRNEQILKMFHEGKEPLAIAKELNLGVGEVQLVVDLFQGEK